MLCIEFAALKDKEDSYERILVSQVNHTRVCWGRKSVDGTSAAAQGRHPHWQVSGAEPSGDSRPGIAFSMGRCRDPSCIML
jgi:hypothetical protein